jgi:hypothetical protein
VHLNQTHYEDVFSGFKFALGIKEDSVNTGFSPKEFRLYKAL